MTDYISAGYLAKQVGISVTGLYHHVYKNNLQAKAKVKLSDKRQGLLFVESDIEKLKEIMKPKETSDDK